MLPCKAVVQLLKRKKKPLMCKGMFVTPAAGTGSISFFFFMFCMYKVGICLEVKEWSADFFTTFLCLRELVPGCRATRQCIYFQCLKDEIGSSFY